MLSLWPRNVNLDGLGIQGHHDYPRHIAWSSDCPQSASGTDTHTYIYIYIDGDNNELSRYHHMLMHFMTYHMLMHFMYETSFSNGERSKSHFGALRASPTMMQSYAIPVATSGTVIRRYTKYLPVILKHGNGKLMDISPINSPIINWNHNNDI